MRSFLLQNLAKNYKRKSLYWKSGITPILQNYQKLLNFDTHAKNKIYDKKALFLKAEKSNFIQEKDNEKISKYFPNHSIVTVKDTGHWIHYQNLTTFCQIIEQYLN